MQIPSKSSDEFIKTITEKSEKIRASFLEKIEIATRNFPIKVMLGDSTVTEQVTFDSDLVKQYFQNILKKLPDWKSQGVSATSDKDLRRIFIKFNIREGNYLLSCHMSLQYHALLYYKLDHRVIEIQKELSEILDKTKNLESEITQKGDRLIHEKLKEIGREDVDQQKLFEILFQNEEITTSLVDKIYSDADKQFHQLSKTKSDLFSELDNMLIEIYHTTPVMIDEVRMIAAEEGCLCHFDLEHVKKEGKEGNFDPARISAKVKENLLKRINEVFDATESEK